MAKGKKSSGKKYISKGLYPTISKKNKVKLPQSTDSLLQSIEFKSRIIKNPKTKEEQRLSLKFKEELSILERAKALVKEHDKLTLARAIQAVKTDWVSQLKVRLSNV